MAARTEGASMPRRRNCFSTMSARCGAYSLTSGMRNRRGVFFPDPGFEDFFHLREGEVAFVFAIVKMRREAHTGFGAVVDQDVAREKFAANFVRMRAFDRDGSGALGGIFWRVDLPAARLRAFDQPRGHARGLLADGCDADLIENAQAGAASKKRGNVRRAVQIAVGIFARVDGAGLKGKRAAMGDPAGERGLQFGAQVLADVEISDSGAAAEPLEHAADREIGAEGANIDGNGPGGLESVENDVRANAVGACDDGARVDDEGAAKENERNRNEHRGFIDRGEELFQVEADRVFRRDNFHASAEAALLVIEILDRRKLEVDHHNFVARAAEVKTGRNHRLRERDILMKRNLARLRAKQRSDLVAHADGHLPPAFFPGAYATLGPGIGVRAHAVVDAAGHG